MHEDFTLTYRIFPIGPSISSIFLLPSGKGEKKKKELGRNACDWCVLAREAPTEF